MTRIKSDSYADLQSMAIRAIRGQAAVIVRGRETRETRETANPPGPCGFITKPFNAQELKNAIRAAAHGLSVFSNSAVEALCQKRKSSRADFIREKKLNPRETQALDFLARFLANKEIADQLSVSIPVAEKILRKVYRKLGARTRSGVIVIWRSVQ